jgi:hypothetical protein
MKQPKEFKDYLQIELDNYIVNVHPIDETHFRQIITPSHNPQGCVRHIDEMKNTNYYSTTKKYLAKKAYNVK